MPLKNIYLVVIIYVKNNFCVVYFCIKMFKKIEVNLIKSILKCDFFITFLFNTF